MSTTAKEDTSLAGIRAKWIAPPGQPGLNFTFLARREFDVAALPKDATLRITADTRYVVYINGSLVGSGPARGTHKRYFVDSWDVGGLLRAGRNHIAVEVHCPNKAFYTVAPFAPGLLAEIDGIVWTDETWETIPDPSRRSDALEYTLQIGYSECRDLRKELQGWQTFSDSGAQWKRACALAEAGSFGGRGLASRDIPPLAETTYRPECVVKTGCVSSHKEAIEDDLDYAGLMRMENHFEAAFPRAENADALTRGGAMTIMPSKIRSRGAYCLLDFRRELLGSVEIDVEAPEGTIFDVGYDEDAAQGRLLTKSAATRQRDYRFADRYILRAGRQKIEHRLHDRGLRFMQLVFRRFSGPVRLHSVRVTHRVYPLSREEASFECDQTFLNRLWEMCRETMSVCCTDTFIDCPWREQSFWLNDQLIVNLFYLSLTADPALARRCLRVGADGALPDGMIPAVYPSDRTCLFASLPAIWTIVLSDYFQRTADRTLLRELLPVMSRALDLYDTWRDAEGMVVSPAHLSNFIDWGYLNADIELGNRTSVFNILIAAAHKRAAGLYTAVGDVESAQSAQRKSQAAMDAVIRCFWRKDMQRFDDGEPLPGLPVTFSQQGHALALHFDLLEEPYRSGALKAMTDPAAIRADFYFQHFVLGALVRNGRSADAVGVIRDVWGKVVQSGSPTIWESVRGRDAFSNCGSLCHAFSCSPLHFMQSVILGVRPLKPGFEEFAFEPRSAGILRARGGVPTPHGQIRVAWSMDDNGRLAAEIVVPDGTSALMADGRRLGRGAHGLLLDSQA